MKIIFAMMACVVLTACAAQTGKLRNHELREVRNQVIPLDKHHNAVVIYPVYTSDEIKTEVEQPDNAAGPAEVRTEAVQATVSAQHKVEPPSAASKALGKLVWFGGGLLLLGVIGVGLRFTPIGTVVPIGLSVFVGAAGGLLIAYATVLDTAPWWVTLLCIIGAVAAGFAVAMRDNFKLTKAIRAE